MNPPRRGFSATAGAGPDRGQGQVLLVLVLGGVAGCLARYGLGLALPTPPGGWPVATLVINLSGALAVGFLLEHLARAGTDVGGRRLVRVGLGTGFLGTFTTYSSLAVEVDLLTGSGRVGLALGYGVVSVLAGVALTGVGVVAASSWARRHRTGPEVSR